MQFPRLHPSLFAPIFARCRFLTHSSFYRLAQFRTLVPSTHVNSNEIQRYVNREIRSQITNQMPALIDDIADNLAHKFIADLLKPGLYLWREGTITTLNDLETRLKGDFNPWLKGSQDSIHPIVNEWVAKLFKKIEPEIETIAKKYQFSTGTIQFLGNITMDRFSFTAGGINDDPTSISAIVGIITGIVTLAVTIAIGVIIEALTGPLGEIAFAIFAILVYINPWLGGIIGWAAVANAMKKRNIPVWIRKAGLSEKKIDSIGVSEFANIANAFKSGFASDSPITTDMQDKIFTSINAHIQEKVDRAKLLILF